MNIQNIINDVCWHDKDIRFTKRFNSHVQDCIDKFIPQMANKNQSTSYYTEFRNASKAEVDNRAAKLGEFAAACWLYLSGFPTVTPDCSVYSKDKKNWDCDLPYGKKHPTFPNCHVKTCSQFTRSLLERNKTADRQSSFTFQLRNPNGRGGRDKLFDDPESRDLVIFVYVSDKKEIEIVASAPWNKIQGILKDPIIDKYKGQKKCIYSSDLKELARQDLCV